MTWTGTPPRWLSVHKRRNVAKGNLSGRFFAGLMAMAMLVPTMAIADGGRTADTQATTSTSTSATTHEQHVRNNRKTSDQSNRVQSTAAIQTPAPQSDTTKSNTARSTSPNQVAPIQPGTTSGRSTLNNMLDTDNARVTSIKQTSRSTGTAPFDKDNDPGDDRDADNGIVRSFDTVIYDFTFSVNSLDDTTYRQARIGFQFTLNQPKDLIAFDQDSMPWIDNTPGYEPKLEQKSINGQTTQVLTVYRLLTATSNSAIVIPSTSSVSLVLQVRNMANGSSFAPQVQAWCAPDPTTRTEPASAASDSVTVSAKPNLNLRITGGTNEGSGNQTFDFDTTEAHNYINHELGKSKGIISKFNWAVDMRWPDRSKGLKGLEVPTGPITFSISLSNLWQTSGGKVFPKIKDLQPYFWDIGTIDGDFNNSGRNTINQGWSPSFNNYDYARSTGGQAGKDRVQGNGKYTVAEHRSDQGLVLDFTVEDYRTNDPFPKFGHTYATDRCTTILASTDCSQVEVAEISTGYLYVFNPSTVQGKDVANYYGQSGLSLQSQVNDGRLGATSISGQQLPAVSDTKDVSNQADQSDDEWHNVIFAQGSETWQPGISNIIQYSCMSLPNYFDNGVDCGWWNAPDNKQGTDSALAGTQVRIMAGFNAKTSKADLPLLAMSLVKIDPNVLELPSPNQEPPKPDQSGQCRTIADPVPEDHDHYHNELGLPWKGNGDWQNGQDNAFGNPCQNLTMVLYATKRGGGTWNNDQEQANADMKDLNFYKTPDEARKHGSIVGILLGARTAASSSFIYDENNSNKNPRYGFGGFVINVRADAKEGSVAQLTSVSRAFTRSQLADLAGLDPVNSSDQDWEDWAEKQNPYELSQNRSPVFATSTGGYTKARYDQTKGYLGGDTGGNEHGDSLYVAGEASTISNTVAQMGTNSDPKGSFDIDRDQRYVDWRLTINTGTSASQADKPAKTDLYVTDVLPAKLHYIPGSARLGGTYTEGTPEMGHIEGGTVCEPSVSTTETPGETKLSWTLPDIPVDGSNHVIYFSASVGDQTDPSKDVASPYENLKTHAEVQSKHNMSKPSSFMDTVSTSTIRAVRNNATSLSTLPQQAINETGDHIGFTNMLSNTADSGKKYHYAVDIMPYSHASGNPGKPDFQGSPTLADMSVKLTGVDLKNVHIYYTTESKWQVNDTASITPSEFQDWPEAELDPATGKVSMSPDVTAWAFMVDGQPGQFRCDITFHINPGNSSTGNLYRNRWGNAQNQMSTQSVVAQRSVSGIAWYDLNGDGIRGADDPLLNGVKVTLLDNQNNPVRSVVAPHDELTTETNAQGRYNLTNIPAGQFHLRFDPAEGTDWSHLNTTTPQAAGATESENSSAHDLTEDGILKAAVIELDDFKQAAEMDTASQSQDFNNCGLKGLMRTDEVKADVEVQLQGRDWLNSDSFTLNVEPVNGAPATALPEHINITADHKELQVPVKMEAFPSDGTYQYRVSQAIGNLPGLTYDKGNAKLTITLKTNAGQLYRTATATWADDKGQEISKAVFTNTYKTHSATVKITAFKRLDGRSLKGGEFTFRLSKDGEPLTEASNKADGTVEFPDQTLDQPGDYTYYVNEVQGSLPGITYDQSTPKITVHATDDHQGQLQVTITGNNPTFTNTYKAQTDNPGNADNPDHSGNSGEPDKPDKPGNPDKPDRPDNSGDPGNPGEPDKADKPDNSGGNDKPNPPVEPNKSSESDHASSELGQTSNSQKPLPGSQSSDDQAKSSTDSSSLADSGSDIVMPAALTIGTAVLGLALMCLLRHRRDRETDLG